ncbi:MAG: Peptidyl-prolyl cis-trans isomerase [uncultured bacterium]|nr:MAG: Peptidyl-prolyl cis-trans isomerase [uncultured bacterium]
MKKKVLVAAVILAAIALGYSLSRSKSVNAPSGKEIEANKKVTESAKKPEEQANNSNNNKAMELKIETTQQGTGERTIKKGDMISVHYTGKLTNGTKFDSSLDRGVPFEFQIGQGMVIQGWEEGFIGAKVGEKRTLTIPAEMGYGSRDMGTIPANSTLIFDVEVMGIK